MLSHFLLVFLHGLNVFDIYDEQCGDGMLAEDNRVNDHMVLFAILSSHQSLTQEVL